MEQNQSDNQKPSDRAEEPELATASCSRLVLQCRFHDRLRGWTEWEEIDQWKLRNKYGETPEEWKESCKSWIEIGGRYEYRIIRRTDTVEWSMIYSENNKVAGSHPATHTQRTD